MTDAVNQGNAIAAAIEALPPLRDVISATGLSARKALGQNFLLDLNLTRRIARTAGQLETGTTVEIGPGPGGLTRALFLEGAARVVAVEKDARAIEALAGLVSAAQGRLTLLPADALSIDLTELGPPPLRVVANLPYNIGTKLLTSWLDAPERFESLTLMFQAEVADRLVAPPGTSDYGRLSILAQWLCRVDRVLDVPARAFTPPPKVESAVVRLIPLPQPLAPAPRAALQTVTRAAFAQRRKMLRGSLKALGGANLLERAGIAPERRPEELSIEEFCRLARALDGT